MTATVTSVYKARDGLVVLIKADSILKTIHRIGHFPSEDDLYGDDSGIYMYPTGSNTDPLQLDSSSNVMETADLDVVMVIPVRTETDDDLIEKFDTAFKDLINATPQLAVTGVDDSNIISHKWDYHRNGNILNVIMTIVLRIELR